MPHASTPPETTSTALLVACLCAQWCGTCTEYQPLFAQLQADFPGARFVWVDIEDEADLVDPVEVENFPTILIAQGEQPRFFGTVMPHLETLRRLIQSSSAPDARAVQAPEVLALAQRLRAR
nr:thioredoxin family protein [uncultured Rhodoferax sp.]